MAQAAFGGVLLAGELVSMVKTLTASARNPSPCWPSHLEGTRRLWQGGEVSAGCFRSSFGAIGSSEGSLPQSFMSQVQVCPGMLEGPLCQRAWWGQAGWEPWNCGGRAAGTRNKWIHCNRMSQRCSRWTCQLLSVLTPLWVSLNVPLGHRGHHLSHFTRSAWSNGVER